jgi:hypothetical protein
MYTRELFDFSDGYATEKVNKQLPISWSSRATSIPGTESEVWAISFAYIFTEIALRFWWFFDNEKNVWVALLSETIYKKSGRWTISLFMWWIPFPKFKQERLAI